MLKAVIVYYGVNPPPTGHNIFALVNYCARLSSEFNHIDVRKVRKLSGVYTETRYPGLLGMITSGKPSKAEAKQMYEAALEIVQFCKNLMQI